MTRLVRSGWPWRTRPHLQAELLVGMDGGEAGELGAARSCSGGRPMMAVTRSSVGPRPLPPGRVSPSISSPARRLVLADDPLADVDVAVGGQVAGLAAPEEAGAPPGDLEDAEHQARGHGALDPVQDGGEPLGAGHAERLAEAELVEEVVRDPGHLLRGRPLERAGEQGDEPPYRGGLPGNVGMDVDLAVLDLDPEKHGRLALGHPMVAPRLLLLQPLGQGGSLRE